MTGKRTFLPALLVAMAGVLLAADPRKAARDCNAGNRRACAALVASLTSRTIYRDEIPAHVEAVRTLTDQATLVQIARIGAINEVRSAAIVRVADQAVIVTIARTDFAWKVRLAAVGVLGDQKVLDSIARGDDELEVRRAAVERLHDQGLLGALASNGD